MFLPLLQVFFLSHLVSSAKMLPPGASITSEASLYATVTDLSDSPAGCREKEMGAAEGPWKVQGWISSWKYPSDRCISLPTLLALLLFSLLQIPSPLVSWREQVTAELEAHPYKPKSRRSHLHLPYESLFWSLNGWGPGLADLDRQGLRLSLLCELHSKCSSVWGSSRGIWPHVITACLLGMPRGKASRRTLLCKVGASSFLPWAALLQCFPPCSGRLRSFCCIVSLPTSSHSSLTQVEVSSNTAQNVVCAPRLGILGLEERDRTGPGDGCECCHLLRCSIGVLRCQDISRTKAISAAVGTHPSPTSAAQKHKEGLPSSTTAPSSPQPSLLASSCSL